MAAYASDGDSSETNTNQDLKQKNTGSGDSANFNCDENLIKAGVNEQECNGLDLESATLSVCKEVFPNEEFSSEDFTFTVTGNDPSPEEFAGSANCVDVTIGPGEYTVSKTEVPEAEATEIIDSDCVQDPNDRLRATGEIQAGETQICTFRNFSPN